MTLGEKIELGRKKNGLSKEDFASILNISLEVANAIEDNKYLPDTKLMIEISNVLNLSLDYLLKDIKEQEIVENKIVENKKEEKVRKNKKKHIKSSSLTTIKCLLIIEIIVSTILFTFIGLANDVRLGWIAGLARIFVSVPIAIHSVNKIKKSNKKVIF